MLSNKHINTNNMARKATSHMVVEEKGKSKSPMAEALAEAWMQGEHQFVKVTIQSASGTMLADQWRDGTRARLPEAMRAGFDQFMAGR